MTIMSVGEGSRFECNYDCQIGSFRTMKMVENVDCREP